MLNCRYTSNIEQRWNTHWSHSWCSCSQNVHAAKWMNHSLHKLHFKTDW